MSLSAKTVVSDLVCQDSDQWACLPRQWLVTLSAKTVVQAQPAAATRLFTSARTAMVSTRPHKNGHQTILIIFRELIEKKWENDWKCLTSCQFYCHISFHVQGIFNLPCSPPCCQTPPLPPETIHFITIVCKPLWCLIWHFSSKTRIVFLNDCEIVEINPFAATW